MRLIHSLHAYLRNTTVAIPRLALRGFMVMIIVIPGCSEHESSRHAPAVDTGLPKRRAITSLGMDRGFTARSVLSCPTGECIVLHYPVTFVTDSVEVEEFYRNVKNVVEGDPTTNEDDGEVVIDEPSHWNNGQRLGGAQATFNCCTYSLADVVGLTKADWISPNPIDATENTIPMKVLLDSYFEEIHFESSLQFDWQRLETDPRFQDGDVFCYVFSGNDVLSSGGIRKFIHVGKILRKNERNWLVSKMGVGPIVRSGLGNTGKLFEGEFNQIRVYRRLPKSV